MYELNNSKINIELNDQIVRYFADKDMTIEEF